MSIFESIKTLFKELSEIFQNLLNIIYQLFDYIIPIINKFFIKSFDKLFNGDKFKMYISGIRPITEKHWYMLIVTFMRVLKWLGY